MLYDTLLSCSPFCTDFVGSKSISYSMKPDLQEKSNMFIIILSVSSYCVDRGYDLKGKAKL